MKKNEIKPIKESDLPPFLRAIWRVSPERMRIQIMLASIICCCALSPRIRVKYCYDPGYHMLVANLLCIGRSACGKGVMRWIVFLLLGPLIERDNAERRKEQEYKDFCRKKGNVKKELPDEPLTVVRYMQNITVPKLVKRADFMVRRYGDPLSFFIFSDELAMLTKGSGKEREEREAVGRTSYMLGEMYVRETLYQDGYNAMVDINTASVVCGQEYALRKYIGDSAIMGGDAGRNIIVRMDGGLGEEAPVIQPFTEEEEALIESTTNQLMRETYTEDDKLQPIYKVDMSWLDGDVERWCAAQRDLVDKGAGAAHDSFYKRSSSSSFRLATMIYHLWGEKEEVQESVRKFYYWAAQFILDGQLDHWGQRFNELASSESGCSERQPTLYDQLPKRFTRDQVCQLVDKLKLGTEGRKFIYKWKTKKRWIKEVEKDVYEKK